MRDPELYRIAYLDENGDWLAVEKRAAKNMQQVVLLARFYAPDLAVRIQIKDSSGVGEWSGYVQMKEEVRA